jgi:hypothetical protein
MGHGSGKACKFKLRASAAKKITQQKQRLILKDSGLLPARGAGCAKFAHYKNQTLSAQRDQQNGDFAHLFDRAQDISGLTVDLGEAQPR